MLQAYIENDDAHETEFEIQGHLSRTLGVEMAVAQRTEISVDVHSQLGSGRGAVRLPVGEHGGKRALSLNRDMAGTIVANAPCSRPSFQWFCTCLQVFLYLGVECSHVESSHSQRS